MKMSKGIKPSPKVRKPHHGPGKGQENGSREGHIRHFDAGLLARRIEEKLGFVRFERADTYFLKTGSKKLNAVMGTRDLGMPYGRIIEMRGLESGGKTTTALLLMAKAQQDGAGIGKIDLENSHDDMWDRRMGVDPDSMILIQPNLGYSGKIKKIKEGSKNRKVLVKRQIGEDDIPDMKSAEQVFSEAELGMNALRKLGFKKQFWILDSIANLRTSMQIQAGNMGKDMRTSNDRAMFLSDVLPKWVALAAGYNATIVLINQVRNSMDMFGDPETSPGGRALRHNCHVRVKVRKVKGGKLMQAGKKVGLLSIVSNFKNKTGHGSEDGQECAIKIRWDKTPATLEVLSVEDAKKG